MEIPEPTPQEGNTRSQWYRATLQCLDFLSFQTVHSLVDLGDSVRVAAAVACFALGTAPAAWLAEAPWLSIIYGTLGLLRVVARKRSMVTVIGCALAAAIVMASLTHPFDQAAAVLVVIVSEPLWITTFTQTLEESFDIFSSILFVFFGILFTFGIYPLTLFMAEAGMKAAQASETAQSAHPAPHGDAGAAGPVAHGGAASEKPAAVAAAEQGGVFALLTTLVLPLVALLVGVPLLAGMALVYCWLCEHMPRMLTNVVVTAMAWVVMTGCLILFHVKVNQDFMGKGLLMTACLVMFDACGRHAYGEDWRATCPAMRFAIAAFVLTFAADMSIPHSCSARAQLLLVVAICCKSAYTAAAKGIACGGWLHPENLLPTAAEATNAVHDDSSTHEGRLLEES